MKDLILFIAFLAAVAYLIICGINEKQSGCQQYGVEWNFVDGRPGYCVNNTGDMKGVKRTL